MDSHPSSKVWKECALKWSLTTMKHVVSLLAVQRVGFLATSKYPVETHSAEAPRIATTRVSARSIRYGELMKTHHIQGANILKRAIEYMCQGPFDSDREDALDILNRAIEECF